jgi:hypothetical protein
MAQTVQLGAGVTGKIRSFWGFVGLNIITLGIYYYFWYFNINEELKEIGRAKGDPELAGSSPVNSLMAILFGWIIIVPPFISIYRTSKRIKRAEKLGGVSDTLHPGLTFILIFPLGILVIPAYIATYMIIKHQNRALIAASGARV